MLKIKSHIKNYLHPEKEIKPAIREAKYVQFYLLEKKFTGVFSYSMKISFHPFPIISMK
jgi:hypothetical protein